jgi:hypothetical protein
MLIIYFNKQNLSLCRIYKHLNINFFQNHLLLLLKKLESPCLKHRDVFALCLKHLLRLAEPDYSLGDISRPSFLSPRGGEEGGPGFSTFLLLPPLSNGIFLYPGSLNAFLIKLVL